MTAREGIAVRPHHYQFANGVVLGVEGDDLFTHVRGFGLVRGQATLDNGRTVATTYNVGDSLVGTVRGRIGASATLSAGRCSMPPEAWRWARSP